jgi:glycosyltransferase 2 family protein
MNEGTPPRRLVRKLAMGAAGVAFGAALFFLALRQVDLAEVTRLFRALDPTFVVGAWLAYAASIAVRILRWRYLLQGIVPTVSTKAVAETLLAGYAVNNVLPARLGELFRADYAKRRLNIRRSSALGSIITERLLDGVVVVLLLWLGLVVSRAGRVGGGGHVLVTIAVMATAMIVLAVAMITLLAAFMRSGQRLPVSLAGRLNQLVAGIVAQRRGARLAVASASVGVWLAETVALWLVCRATGAALSVGQTMTLMGAASLSTLVPTAPAFLGSYQYVFVIVMGAFGLPESAGIVAATTIQALFYGSVTVAGLGPLLVTATRSLRAPKSAGPDQGVPRNNSSK